MRPLKGKDGAMTPKRIVFLVLGLLFATLIVQNAEVVQVRFLFWSAQASRALILLGTFILGLIVGYVSGRVRKKETAMPVSTEK
jgi:putative membrane protein